MRRFALTCLCLALSGCGYNTWSNPPFTTGSNPNLPADDSENMRRVMGEQVEAPTLTPEPGDIWPGPLPPSPTLQDLERQGRAEQPQRPVPGSPEYQGQQPPICRRRPPPMAVRPHPLRTSRDWLRCRRQRHRGQPTRRRPRATQPGRSSPTQQGPAVTTGGTSDYQTTTTPGGGSAIVVPNGNGTSTIIHSDGRIETVPTPR